MSAWAFLVGNFAHTDKDLSVFNEAMTEIQEQALEQYDSALLVLIWEWIIAMDSDHGSNVGELMYRLERVGYSRPEGLGDD